MIDKYFRDVTHLRSLICVPLRKKRAVTQLLLRVDEQMKDKAMIRTWKEAGRGMTCAMAGSSAPSDCTAMPLFCS